MDELAAQGISENTLIVIMADNGPMTHNGPPGIANARLETIKASNPRFSKDEVPFDVEAVMKESGKWENFEANWGIE